MYWTCAATILLFMPGLAMASAIRGRGGGAWAERLAVAYPLGALIVTALVNAWGGFGLPFSRSAFAALALGATAAAAVALWLRRPGNPPPPVRTNVPSVPVVLLAPMVALGVGRLAFVVAEVLRRPLTPADAFMVWALRARVWAAHGGFVLDPSDPFFGAAASRADYPRHVSLLQTWHAVWLGHWSETLVNVPWAMDYASLAAFVFAVSKRRLPWSWAVALASVAGGIPLLVAQAAVAGYADLMLATSFTVAAVSLALWAGERRGEDLALALVFAAGLPFTKLEGLLLAGILAAAALWVSMERGGRLLRGGAALVALVAAAAVAWINPALRRAVAEASFEPKMLGSVARAAFGLGNWHFLWAACLTAVAVGWRSLRAARELRVLAPVTIAAFLWPWALFGVTQVGRHVMLGTAESRMLLTPLPAAVVLLGWALARELGRLQRNRPAASRRRSAAAATAFVLACAWGCGQRPVSWRIPSSQWLLHPSHGRLFYRGRPIPVDGSPGVIVRLRPGGDAGPGWMAWRRIEDRADSRVVVKLRRNRPWHFVDLRDQPNWNGTLAGLGFLLRPELVAAIREVELVPAGAGATLARWWEEFITPEIFDYYSVHLVYGPRIAGRSWVPALCGLAVVLVAAAFAGPPRRRAAAAVLLLLLWMLCDVRFARDLGATWGVDRARFTGRHEDLARYDGLEAQYRQLAEAARRVLPPGAPVRLISQGAQYLNRAAYMFFPHRVVNWLVPARLPARHAVLFYPPQGTFDPGRGLLQLPSAGARRVGVLAHPSPAAWIVELDPG